MVKFGNNATLCKNYSNITTVVLLNELRWLLKEREKVGSIFMVDSEV